VVGRIGIGTARGYSFAESGDGMKERNGKRRTNEWEENACPRCRGTGMVCGHKAGDSARGLLRGFRQRHLPGVWGNGEESEQKGGKQRRLTPDQDKLFDLPDSL
jgi:hypothetical protein